MSFNTNYILSGDDKNQIIAKSNYNFSQILSNAVGLPGQKGTIGPTGIVGQVGKDGDEGATGSRANQWFFQNTPPYGDLPVDEWPLINYDVWVDTSPGSTGGPNRIYYYNDDYTLGIYPFWFDTGSNFIVDGPLTIIQGISGPGEVTENNAIVMQSSSSPDDTFVFTDGTVSTTTANPNYAKVLIGSDASTTASLPVFSFGKTFYSTSNLPSFYWDTTSSDYGIRLSSEGEISIQSYATGSYGSTGGTSSIGGQNINIDSLTGIEVSATGAGITINSPSIGFSDRNIDLQEGQLSFSNMDSGVGISGPVSSYALDISGVLLGSQTGERTVLKYLSSPGSSNKGLYLSMEKSPIFQVGSNLPSGPTAGTYPDLIIGYTGSTGVSGGTGANIVKDYQEIVSPASSLSLFNGLSDFSNYIEITPSNDNIIITPSATGSLSTSSRVNRIWITLPDISSVLESNNVSVFDLYMNSTTYSFGGIFVPTNLSYSPSEFYISDNGTGATGGCRHVRLTFFGSEFPSAVNSTGNKYFYAQSFVSGESSSSILAYYYSPEGSPFFFGRLTVICTELHRQGFMRDEIRNADEMFGRMIIETRPEVMIGYHTWALPIVDLMKKSKLFTRLVWFVAKPWAYQMAYEMGVRKQGSFVGKILMNFGIWASGIIGKIKTSSSKGNKKINFEI